jgi:hypothetical protein
MCIAVISNTNNVYGNVLWGRPNGHLRMPYVVAVKDDWEPQYLMTSIASHKGLPSLSDAATGSSTCRERQYRSWPVSTKPMLLVLGFCMLVAAFIGLLVAYYLYRRKQRISSSAAGN